MLYVVIKDDDKVDPQKAFTKRSIPDLVIERFIAPCREDPMN